jgi:hypothetical protein
MEAPWRGFFTCKPLVTELYKRNDKKQAVRLFMAGCTIAEDATVDLGLKGMKAILAGQSGEEGRDKGLKD